MGSKPKAPEPMNVGAVTAQANQQNTANAFQNAAMNRVNQTDALGNTLNYSQTGTDSRGNPIFSAQQNLGQTGQMYAGGLADLGQRYFDTVSSRPDMGSNAAFDRAYGYASANLEPRFQRQADANENKLRNQGFEAGSEAYRNSSNDLALQQNEARNNLVTQLQGQMFQQGLADRQQQLSELNPGVQFGNDALSMDQVNVPQVGVQNVDVAGLNAQNYAQQQAAYNAQMQQRGAMLGGLASIGGTLAGAALGGPIGASLGGSLFGKAGSAGSVKASNPSWAPYSIG
jgi:hypothetical protein